MKDTFSSFEKTVTLFANIVTILSFAIAALDRLGLVSAPVLQVKSKSAGHAAIILFSCLASYGWATFLLQRKRDGEQIAIPWLLGIVAYPMSCSYLIQLFVPAPVHFTPPLDAVGLDNLPPEWRFWVSICAIINLAITFVYYVYPYVYPHAYTIFPPGRAFGAYWFVLLHFLCLYAGMALFAPSVGN